MGFPHVSWLLYLPCVYVLTHFVTTYKLNKFYAAYGKNVKSTQDIISSSVLWSATQCGGICDRMDNCGGYNARDALNGQVECEFMSGGATLFDIQADDGTIYYEGIVVVYALLSIRSIPEEVVCV